MHVKSAAHGDYNEARPFCASVLRGPSACAGGYTLRLAQTLEASWQPSAATCRAQRALAGPR